MPTAALPQGTIHYVETGSGAARSCSSTAT